MIAEVLAYYGLKTFRPNLKGWQPIACPWHSDSRASASMNLDNEGFRCHVCKDEDGKPLSGNAVTIVMREEGLSFVDSIEFIKAELGVSNPKLRAKPKPSRTVPGRKVDLNRDGSQVPPWRR